jgi:hypothetical protein
VLQEGVHAKTAAENVVIPLALLRTPCYYMQIVGSVGLDQVTSAANAGLTEFREQGHA